jgi:hypothetical protein
MCRAVLANLALHASIIEINQKIRSRKIGSMSMVSYLSSAFIYAKVANLVLFFRADPRMGLVYLLLFVTQVRKTVIGQNVPYSK